VNWSFPTAHPRQAVDVLIFVEHIARELESACLLQHYLQSVHGLSAQVSFSAYTAHAVLSRIMPRVVVLPHCRAQFNSSVTYWWDNVPIVNLAWEQILSNVNKQANVPHDAFVRDHVKYFCWGQSHHDYLLECKVPRGNLSVVGSPNFTLLDERYRFLCRDRDQLAREFGLDAEKRWVFIPENYGWAFLQDDQVEKRVESGSYSRENALAYRSFQQRGLNIFLDWLSLARDRSDVEIILRPRPSTPLERFVGACGDRTGANVTITKDGTAREWLLASDVVLSNYSTVQVDAAVAGKPTFNIRPEAIPEFMQAEFLDYVPVIRSSSEFLDVIAGRGEFDAESSALRAYAVDNFHAPGDMFQHAAQEIARIYREAPGKPKYLYGRGWYRWDPTWRRLIPRSLRMGVSRLVNGTTLPGDWDGDRPFLRETFSDDWPDHEKVKQLQDLIASNLEGPQRLPCPNSFQGARRDSDLASCSTAANR
jgi:surface carbohydrate biosynthesis protein